MSDKLLFPNLVAGKIDDATQDLVDAAQKKYGVTTGALVRMALQSFLPGYLISGQPEGGAQEFLASVAEAVADDPKLKPKIEALVARTLRGKEAA